MLFMYCVLSMTIGPSGIIASKNAARIYEDMYQNLNSLALLNEKYSKDYQAVLENNNTQALEARSLGYIAEGEVALRINIKTPLIEPEEPGSIIYYQASSVMTDIQIKILTLLIALLVFAFCLFLKAVKYSHKRSSKSYSFSKPSAV